ncbi:Gfo/Idh/MocA family oxidoreductase [Micromonospora sp. NPDC047134]|uniref:Gfo/Idh/MocA family protein n=1 Tax=Micromonospora sp. NPDC047134 TaxID=3154340 RepID=UPI00340D4FB0
MGRRLRSGLVGFGWVSRSVWLPRLQQHPDCDMVAVHDPYLTTPVAGLTRVGSLGQLVEAGLDLAVVATPNHLHAEAAGFLLSAGVPVVVEKPLCLSSAELAGLVRQATQGRVGFQVSRPAPRRHDVEQLTALVAQLLVGPVQVHATWLRRQGVPRPGSWFTRRAQAGGGALVDLGWHLADVAAGLLGEAALAQVDATLTTGADASALQAAWRRDDPGRTATDAVVDVETDGELRARFTDGSTLYLRAAWACDVAVDTTRFEVRGRTADGRDAVLTLETTFGFSPNRVAEPFLETRVGDRSTRLPVTAPIGAEFDRQVAATVLLADQERTDTAELRRSAWVLGLLETAYRVAGRPLTPDAPQAVVEVPVARVAVRG